MPRGRGRGGGGGQKGSSVQMVVKESPDALEMPKVETAFEEVQGPDTGTAETKGRGRPRKPRVQKTVLSDVVADSSRESEEKGMVLGHNSLDIEAHLSELRSPLPSELRTVLLPFLSSHPTMLLSTSPYHRGPAYMLLGEFLLFVGRNSLGALMDKKHGEFLSLLNALSEFSFESTWLERIRSQVISSSEDSPFQALSRVSASKEYARAKVEQLSAEAVHLAKTLEENDLALQEHVNVVKALEEEESRLLSHLDAPLFKL